jgi:hypothetical protein
MATPGRTVQLRSVQNVLEAYENWDTPHFAIWNAKQLLFAYDKNEGSIDEGIQLLQQWLQWIEAGESAGIYTLAIYKDPVKSITNATPYNGSVNFQLHQYQYGGNGGGQLMAGASDPGIKMLVDEMKAMRLELNKIQKDQDGTDDDDDGDMLGKVATLLNNPIVTGIIGSLFPNIKPGKPTHMAAIPNPSGHSTRIAGVTTSDADNQKRIADALAKLQQTVPNLPDILEKLSQLAEKKPSNFQFYTTALMSMKL